MTSATVAKTAAKTTQSQAKPEKIRRDHKVNTVNGTNIIARKK